MPPLRLRSIRPVHPWIRPLLGVVALAVLALLPTGCDSPAGGQTGSESGIQIASEPLAAVLDDAPLEHAKKHLDPKYVCPMHPQIVRDQPGSCPICGMTLVETRLDEDTDGAGHPQVSLSPAVVQNLGVRTATAQRGDLWMHVRAVGRVAYDETRLVHVHPRADGWIEELVVRAEGEPVSKGQELARLYSPKILNAQVDFLLALEPQPKGVAQVKVDKARNILRLLDLPDDVIRDIEQRRETRNTVPIRAPLDGVVTGLKARDGMYVSESTEMFTVADLSRVWVLVDVFESQLDWLAAGQPAEITIPARPGRNWEGKVDYLYPELDPRTRTLKVRLVFPNPDLVLKPNMFADVVIHGGPKHDVLMVPDEALIVTGEREAVVKALGKGRFAPVDVESGMRRQGMVEILSGLEEGDQVVVSGQFLIDSESSLQASFRRMEEADPAPTESGHGPEVP